jgi:hypothetical protein
VTLPLTAKAQQLIGAWRATDECFLAAFILTGNGRAQAVYLSGERDDNAAWTLDGGTLRITPQAFPLDRGGEPPQAEFTTSLEQLVDGKVA